MAETEPRVPTPAPSPWSLLGTVVTDPMRAFQAIADRPAILPGYLLQMVMAGISTALIMPKMSGLISEQLAASNVPAEAMAMAGTIGKVSAVAGVIVTPWLAGLLVSLIAMFFGQFQGTSVPFRTYFSMVGYARLPIALLAVIQAVLTMPAKTMAEVSSVSLSLAVLLPADASPLLRGVASAFNPFDIWYVVLLAIGFGAVNRTEPKKGTSFAVAIFVAGVLLAISSAFTAARATGVGM